MTHHHHLLELPIETNIRGMDSRVLVDHDYATIKQLIVKPNQTIPIHQVPVDVTFFVLEGRGIITIGEKAYSVEPFSIVTCPKNTNMSVKALDNVLSFLNIKTPGYKPQK
jgi:quercetin dioxygenase-like cupin family protein